MKLTGLHLLLTYVCNFECDHCFVWGSPWQQGTMTAGQVDTILGQAVDLGTIEWIYFEGGEPFLHYAVLLRGAQQAATRGFKVGVVSNGYWATDVNDGIECLRPFKGLIEDLSVSRDAYHGNEESARHAEHALAAARKLGIPTDALSIAEPEVSEASRAVGKLPAGESAVMYRGRAARALSGRVEGRPGAELTSCPCEDLRDPGRVHVDPLGNVHLCQGLCIGNLFHTPLPQICDRYRPDDDPVIGPLLKGGPAALVRRYDLTPAARYADACHLCYEARAALRDRFPARLGPDQMYGVPGEDAGHAPAPVTPPRAGPSSC